MSTIFFYANIHIYDKSLGITKKVLSQIKALRKMGNTVYYSAYGDEDCLIFDNNDQIIYRGKKYDKRRKYSIRKNLLTTSTEFITNSNISFDYGYLRFHFFDINYIKLLKQLKENGAKNIVEAHGYPYANNKLIKRAPVYIIDKMFQPIARKYIDLVAAISNYKNIWGCETVQIDNAINIGEYELKQEDLEKNKITLVTASNEQYYHGYPKLIRSFKEYNKLNKKYEINILFVGEYSESTINLVNSLQLNDKIKFLGKKIGGDLMNIYNSANIGIGALGPHAGSEYGSSIKTKEYFAIGLPFINGWREYAFDDSYPFVKRFDVFTETIDFQEIIDFYESISKESDVAEQMRKFAEENYTWEIQFLKVFKEVQ